MYNPEKPYKESVLEAIKKTWQSSHCQVIPSYPYPYIIKTHNCKYEIDHTDGIGTKGLLHWRHRTFKNAVIDALAMNINDLLAARATPYKLQNHLIVPEDDEAITEIIGHLAEECCKYGLVITGGETSVQNNLRGMDLSITMTGFLRKPVKNRFSTGDILIGLPSTGIHSNGLTFAREVLGDDPDLLEPTKIYWDIWPYLDDVNGIVHIAGGGFKRILEAMEPNQGALLSWNKRPKVFDKLWERTEDSYAMYTRYNCGIGMVLSVPKENIAKKLKGVVLGEVTDKPGLTICSMFDGSIFKVG